MKLAIIGSGFAGLGMAIQLKKAGYHDFVILEKNDDLGGTWRDNRYPGCACDVPSHMYSFSFELNPRWSRMFAPQQEIWDYLRHCVGKYGIGPHIRYGSAVDSLEWDDEDSDSPCRTAPCSPPRRSSRGSARCTCRPTRPSPGADRFGGTAFHSAEWDHSRDLTGKRVAVIGTGASAIQFVPEVANDAARLHVFQRTPPWVQPKPDFALSRAARWAFRYAPGAQRAFRNTLYWALETRAAGFTLDPKLMHPRKDSPARTSPARSRTRRCAPRSPRTTRSAASASCSLGLLPHADQVGCRSGHRRHR